jgi:elongation factor G
MTDTDDSDRAPAPPRCAVLVGAYTSGKTTLLEALLHTAGAIDRMGSVHHGTAVGDTSREARDRRMSVEPNVANAAFLGETWHVIDCPGTVELAYDSRTALMAADMAVVVAEPEPDKALTLAPLFRYLDEQAIPHVLFINKLDKANHSVREVLAALQEVSPQPLVLRQVPIRENGQVTGYVDLVSERAYRYREGAPSDLIQMPDAVAERETEAREAMLESLADHDDALMEKLLDDVVPPPSELYERLAQDVRADALVPVMLGSAANANGVTRLWKALRHETPPPETTARRLGVPDAAGAGADTLAASVVKTFHQPHAGKLSLARIWQGEVKEGAQIAGQRAGLHRMMGAELTKQRRADAGDLVALGRVEPLQTGDLIAGGERVAEPDIIWPAPPAPVYSLAVAPEKRADEVKLTSGLTKLGEEDPSLHTGHDDAGQLLLQGQGDQHLCLALARLQNRFNVAATAQLPATPYRETIRTGTTKHTRFKRQSGGHGQFADITVRIAPLPRGHGVTFTDEIVGGAVPGGYIPAVEAGVREGLQSGPLGYPVVDVAVTLVDGQDHPVDSSEQAFKIAGRMAMSEALPACESVLLEPVDAVTISVPQSLTNKVHSLISQRRGKILGFQGRDDWPGWDAVRAHMPVAELADLIMELRSLTMGVGFFARSYHHLQEVPDKIARRVLRATQPQAAQ